MTNKQIARLLKQTASLIEITGGNTFRARAFENAGRTIERLEVPLAEVAATGELTSLKGIGAGLAAQIKEILERGSFAARDELLEQVPAGVLDLLRIKGLGAKKAYLLWHEVGVTSVEELEEAAAAGRLSTLDGFGPKTVQKLLDEIERYKKYRVRRRYAEAVADARPMLDALNALPGVQAVDVAGEMRRKMETVDAVELVVATQDGSNIPGALAAFGVKVTPAQNEDGTLEGSLPDGFPLRVYLAPPARYGTALWHHTGSENHVAAFVTRYGEPEPAQDEKEIYTRAGIEYVPPELRENTGELEAAAEHRLPRLIEPSDLKGNLHNHSTFSDGTNTIAEMAEAARAMGYSYFGLCDHSRSLAIANGLSIERVLEQQAEIRRLNESYAASGKDRFRIFSGTESDILTDGSLDYPDDVLATFDFVVASVHQGFNMTVEEATRRLIRAIENPYTTILGHATGRLLLSREGYPIDHERVIDACAENEVSIELNANPWRLDMDWRWIRYATERGVLISINPDAHSVEELANTYWGVQVARKGWLTPEQCLNAKSLDAFEEWLNARRKRRIA